MKMNENFQIRQIVRKKCQQPDMIRHRHQWKMCGWTWLDIDNFTTVGYGAGHS